MGEEDISWQLLVGELEWMRRNWGAEWMRRMGMGGWGWEDEKNGRLRGRATPPPAC